MNSVRKLLEIGSRQQAAGSRLVHGLLNSGFLLPAAYRLLPLQAACYLIND
jgi:hypothetical protein